MGLKIRKGENMSLIYGLIGSGCLNKENFPHYNFISKEEKVDKKCFAVIGILRNKPIHYWKNFKKQGFFTWAENEKKAKEIIIKALEKEGVKFEILKTILIFEKL